MPNSDSFSPLSDLFPSSASDSDTTSVDAIGTDVGVTRHQETRRRRGQNRLFAASVLITVGAVVGSGFSAQSSVEAAAAAERESLAATVSLARATGPHPEQVGSLDGVVTAQASSNARSTIAGATSVIAAAQGKTDATALSSSVASLSGYTRLAPEQVFDLVDQVKAETAAVAASTVEADRVAAEQAAAAAAKAAADAAAKAAADAAAAQAAAEAQAAAQAQAQAARAQAAVTAKAAVPQVSAPAPAPAAPARPAAPASPSGAQAIARDLMAAQYGWGGDQFGCLVSLWNKESGWNVNAYNASSGATGIPQALPGSKMASAGADWATNPATQITWGLSYIAGRYGTPCGAWSHSVSSGWY